MGTKAQLNAELDALLAADSSSGDNRVVCYFTGCNGRVGKGWSVTVGEQQVGICGGKDLHDILRANGKVKEPEFQRGMVLYRMARKQQAEG